MAAIVSRRTMFSTLVCLTLLAGCAPAAAPAQPGGGVASPPPKEFSIKLGLVGQGVDLSAPQYAAQERGIWAKHGVNIEITEYNSGPAAQEALAGGSADVIHYFPPGAATAIGKGVKQKMVAADASRPSGWYIMVPAGSSIKTVQDLAGKKMGITAKGATTDYYALWVGDKNKVKFDSVPVGFPALYPGLLAGTVDAAIIPPPLSFKGLQTGELRIIVDLGKEMPPNMPDVVVFSDDFISKNPDGVTAYLKAMFEGIRLMKQEKEYAITFLMKHTKQERSIAEQSYEQIIKDLSEDGSFTKEWLENSLSLAKLAGVSDLPPTDQLYTTKFVPAK